MTRCAATLAGDTPRRGARCWLDVHEDLVHHCSLDRAVSVWRDDDGWESILQSSRFPTLVARAVRERDRREAGETLAERYRRLYEADWTRGGPE